MTISKIEETLTNMRLMAKDFDESQNPMIAHNLDSLIEDIRDFINLPE